MSARFDAKSVTPIRLMPGTMIRDDGGKLMIVRGTQTVPISLSASDSPIEGISIDQAVQSGHLVPTENPQPAIEAAANRLVDRLLA